jgi:hypothetical protein
VDAIRKAVEAGKEEEALKLLTALRETLTVCQAGKDQCGKGGACKEPAVTDEAKPAPQPAVINTKCPIMGTPIDPKNVPAGLYRIHKGQGVGFCCAGCPAAWDTLTEVQKDEKLQAAR